MIQDDHMAVKVGCARCYHPKWFPLASCYSCVIATTKRFLILFPRKAETLHEENLLFSLGTIFWGTFHVPTDCHVNIPSTLDASDLGNHETCTADSPYCMAYFRNCLQNKVCMESSMYTRQQFPPQCMVQMYYGTEGGGAVKYHLCIAIMRAVKPQRYMGIFHCVLIEPLQAEWQNLIPIIKIP